MYGYILGESNTWGNKSQVFFQSTEKVCIRIFNVTYFRNCFINSVLRHHSGNFLVSFFSKAQAVCWRQAFPAGPKSVVLQENS